MAVAVLGRVRWIEQHQHKEPSRAFGALSLQAECPKEHRLGQKTLGLSQRTVRAQLGLREQKIHGRLTQGSFKQDRCHPEEITGYRGFLADKVSNDAVGCSIVGSILHSYVSGFRA